MQIDSLLATTTAALVVTITTFASATKPDDHVLAGTAARIHYVDGPEVRTVQPRLPWRHELGTLPIIFDRVADQVVVYHEESGFYGEGETDAEALDDMIVSMTDLYAVLADRRGDLDDHMARQLRFLEAALLAG